MTHLRSPLPLFPSEGSSQALVSSERSSTVRPAAIHWNCPVGLPAQRLSYRRSAHSYLATLLADADPLLACLSQACAHLLKKHARSLNPRLSVQPRLPCHALQVSIHPADCHAQDFPERTCLSTIPASRLRQDACHAGFHPHPPQGLSKYRDGRPTHKRAMKPRLARAGR